MTATKTLTAPTLCVLIALKARSVVNVDVASSVTVDSDATKPASRHVTTELAQITHRTFASVTSAGPASIALKTVAATTTQHVGMDWEYATNAWTTPKVSTVRSA